MNAIIIAAGLGTRLRPLTLETPKPLIKVFGKPIIEQNIEFLIEKGIKEIVIIIGYLSEKFMYLEKKYSEVKLIKNDKYDIYNNIYSLYLAKEYLKNTYILEGDIYLRENVYQKDIDLNFSFAFSKKLNYQNNEWQLIVNDKNEIQEITISGKNNYIISGPRFLIEKDSKTLKKFLEEYCKDEERKKNLFWDDILKENIKNFKIKVIPLKDESLYEIDTLEELKELDFYYKKLY